MDEIWAVLITLSGVMLAMTVFYMTTFVGSVKSYKKPCGASTLPKAAVYLCLRGSDPYLADTIKSLLKQNYNNYTVKIIIDNETDPATAVVEQVLKETKATNLEYTFLRNILHTCSLKCNSLVQAIAETDPSYEVYAFVDADVVTYPDWLLELVSPLSDPTVGVTTGNRWYIAMGKYWGTLIRYLWNSHIVLHMIALKCPWGGSLAITSKVFHQLDLLNKWSRTLGEDVMLHDELSKVGLQVKFIPSLIMINNEENDLKSLIYWIRRQFVAAGLYHSLWGYGVIEGIFFVAPFFSLIGTGIYYLFMQQWINAAICLGVLLGLTFILIGCKLYMEKLVQPLISAQGREPVEITPWYVVNVIVAALPTMVITIYAAIVSTFFRRHIEWRGVSYYIKSPMDVQLIEYRPYQQTQLPTGSKISL